MQSLWPSGRDMNGVWKDFLVSKQRNWKYGRRSGRERERKERGRDGDIETEV